MTVFRMVNYKLDEGTRIAVFARLHCETRAHNILVEWSSQNTCDLLYQPAYYQLEFDVKLTEIQRTDFFLL